MRELKLRLGWWLWCMPSSRTLPRVRELKHGRAVRNYLDESRTLPRVRELKLSSPASPEPLFGSRTLPRVRELKPEGKRALWE